ncbi:unnamed protein product [Danaus chrysippus]|uniref:(African queen) hypothetical protein n=1 Tax=Danaus chrysippus TaxID=151541 RepID=A0A8J2R2F4_9NEOP|nr:unnamed protein product [Danaus chrysippus]
MVNIIGPDQQPSRAVGERGSTRPGTSSSRRHVWGPRVGRRSRQEQELQEPTNLGHLEYLAHNAVRAMEKHSPPSRCNFEKAMDLLRQKHNMNFLMLCPKCHGSHMYEEIVAPER